MENKREQKRLSKQYRDQSIVLKQANPDINDDDLKTLSNVDRNSFYQILNQQLTKTGEARRDKRILESEDRGVDRAIAAEGRGVDIAIASEGRGTGRALEAEERHAKETRKREERHARTLIEAEQRREETYLKRQALKEQKDELRAAGFSEKQVNKYAGKIVNNKIPKGLTVGLKALFSLKSALVTGKIDRVELETMIKDPIQLAMITGGATDPETELAIQKFIQGQALQNLQRNVVYRNMSSIERNYAVTSKAKSIGLSFGRNYEKNRKPGKLEIELSKNQDKIRKNEAIQRAKEAERIKQLHWKIGRGKPQLSAF